MSLQDVIILAFIFYTLVVQCTTARLHIDDEDDYADDDENDRLAKRFFFHKSTAASTSRPPSVIGNLINPTPIYPSSNPCSSNPCNHGGICTSTGQLTYVCKCIGAWRGIHCSVADACKNSPCQNGGTCLNVHDDYWCKCTSDYYGTNCQKKFSTPDYSVNNCRPNICNTGQCVSFKTSYYCQCPNDRYGEHCEKRFSKRADSGIQSYYNLFHQLKRGMSKQDMQKLHKNPDVAFYDVKNGIYFKKK